MEVALLDENSYLDNYGCPMWNDATVEKHAFLAPSYHGTHGIPSQLLRGPWNQAKGDFLTYAIEATNSPRVTKRQGPVILKGLEDALREHCVPGILALLRVRDRNRKEVRVAEAIMNKIHESSDPSYKASLSFGNCANQDWTTYEHSMHDLRRTGHVSAVGMPHFELLYEAAADPKLTQLGLKGFKALFVMFIKDALIAGVCTRQDLV